jgi:hypothetical protein
VGWNPQVLFAAAKRAGMLTQAVHLPVGGPLVPFDCDYKAPDVLLLGDQQQSTEHEIEYQTAALPPIRKGDVIHVTVAGTPTAFTARAHATKVGDGFYSKVQLQAA